MALDLLGIAALLLVMWAVRSMWRLGDRRLAVAVSLAAWVILLVVLLDSLR